MVDMTQQWVTSGGRSGAVTSKLVRAYSTGNNAVENPGTRVNRCRWSAVDAASLARLSA